MNALNQNTFMASLEDALVPSSQLIDDRTERDWLSFIADFASLINFYDGSNQINGNWSPFLLKDPIIILASISKTNVTKKHTLFLHTCTHINTLYEKDPNDKNISSLINTLFDQLFKLFLKLERWIHFLLKSDQKFSLKEYIINQVENSYSAQLWALLSLRKQLLLNKIIGGSETSDWSDFKPANPEVWEQNKDKKSFWEILQLNHDFLKNKIPDFIQAIKKTGDQLFTFVASICYHARITFEKLKDSKSRFPDTVLLRTFINLLMNHTKQLNEISQKHLNFYYGDILKQKIRTALPDSVFASIELRKKDSVFTLPENTQFNAGLDAQKNPIYFSSGGILNLNPASVLNAKTLYSATSSSNENTIYLQDIPTPSMLKKDESGKIMGWPTFGGNVPPIANAVQLGFAIASPLLLLREGNRTIQLTLNFNESNAISFLNNAKFYLSTQESWLPITPTITQNTKSDTSIILNISLDNKVSAIESFTQNPDGYISEWPLLKIVFNTVPNATIPILNSIQFDISVEELSSLQLFNDFGALDPKKPFELFGPTPAINNNFIIGSNELFSKPLQSFQVNLNWDTLPDSFQSYYLEYNKYITTSESNKNNLQPEPSNKPDSFIGKIVNILKSGLKIITGAIKKVTSTIVDLLKDIIQLLKDLLGIIEPDPTTPFNNVCFTVDFEILNNNSWSTFNMIKEEASTASDGSTTFIPYTSDASCVPEAETASNLLFSTNKKEEKCLLTDTSLFGYNAPSTEENNSSAVDPSIQQKPLVYSNESTSGFVKMTLTGPNPYGFGSQIYPEIVSSVALQNAMIISKDPKTNPKNLVPAAKLPFSPKLKKITANYKVSQKYDLSKTGNYPLYCYAYNPFTNYLTYDNSNGLPTLNFNVGDTIQSPPSSTGVALVSSFYSYKGFLYIELKELIVSSEMNLYVELGRKEGNILSDTKPDYYYLGTNGWEILPVLSDGTYNLSCSGIINFNIPKNCSKSTTVMPTANYWICIATKSDISNYPDITFMQTNGVLLTRSDSNFLTDANEPKITANTITKTKSSIPEIENVIQPFASFGGKAMETEAIKNIRVSNRLKTKDRIANATDYFRMIQEEFSTIYYSKSVYQDNQVKIYVVRKCEDANDYNAFAPKITICLEEKIQQYLSDRVSAFTSVSVANFSFITVIVNATITLFDGYELQGVQKDINEALQLFLSPWISTTTTQIIIDNPLTNVEVINFIKTRPGVSNVSELYFTTSYTDKNGKLITQDQVTTISLVENPELLIASSLNHNINERS